MIRILAVSISAAALIAATVPANAQSRQGGQQFRSSGPSGFSGQRLSGPQFRSQGPSQRNFRSFNPPAPSGRSAQRLQRSFNPPTPGGRGPGQVRSLSRGLTPPTPGIGTTQRAFGPQAPSGGSNFVGGPGIVPASLPAPSLGQSTTTAAPATPGPEQTIAAPGQPVDAPQGDLQAPIPETTTAEADGDKDAPEAAAAPETDAEPTAGMPEGAPEATEEQEGDKVVPGHVVRRVKHGHVYKRVVEYRYQPQRVYVPVYHVQRVYRHEHAYIERHGYRGHGFHGHHGHHNHHGHHFHGGHRHR